MMKNPIIDALKKNKDLLRRKYRVKNIGIFGSAVRKVLKKESDVDVIVEMEKTDFDTLFELREFLEEILGRKVDLVRKRKNISKSLRILEKNIIYV